MTKSDLSLEQMQGIVRRMQAAARCAVTEHEQHRRQDHPDYEYTTTVNARKSGEAPRPEGEGWEENTIIACHLYENGVVVEERWRNWERDDFTEINYWRRRRAQTSETT